LAKYPAHCEEQHCDPKLWLLNQRQFFTSLMVSLYSFLLLGMTSNN